MPQHPIKKTLAFLSGHPLLLLATVTGMTVLAGCATLEQMMQKPTATFSGMQISDADLFNSTAVFSFNINNPNPINIRARHITYDLKLNGRDFVSGQLDHGVALTAGGTSTLQVPVTMAYLDFFESMAQLWRTSSADYALTGGFAVGPFVIPFQAHGVFDLPNMPKLSLESIEIQKLSFSGATLQCRVQMNNPNAFDLLFKKMDYTLSLGGTPLGRASALPPGPIGKNSKSTIALALDVSFAQLGRSAYQLLQGTKADYKLDGGLIFERTGNGESKVPFNLSGRTPLLHQKHKGAM
jgi:LEA14-like dessication related protein